MSVKGGWEVICPMCPTCSHANHKDHRCSKPVKGAALRWLDYRGPQMYTSYEISRKKQLFSATAHAFIQPTDSYQTPTIYHTVQARHFTFECSKTGKACPCMRVCQVAQSCPTFCNPMDWSPPGTSVPRILQARILKWVAVPSSRGSSSPRDWTHIFTSPALGRQILYH